MFNLELKMTSQTPFERQSEIDKALGDLAPVDKRKKKAAPKPAQTQPQRPQIRRPAPTTGKKAEYLPTGRQVIKKQMDYLAYLKNRTVQYIAGGVVAIGLAIGGYLMFGKKNLETTATAVTPKTAVVQTTTATKPTTSTISTTSAYNLSFDPTKEMEKMEKEQANERAAEARNALISRYEAECNFKGINPPKDPSKLSSQELEQLIDDVIEGKYLQGIESSTKTNGVTKPEMFIPELYVKGTLEVGGTDKAYAVAKKSGRSLDLKVGDIIDGCTVIEIHKGWVILEDTKGRPIGYYLSNK